MDIVPASQWRRERWRTPAAIPTPTSEVWLHHGAAGTSSLATLRAYERHHVRINGWAALGYSFAVAGGKVYEGRGAARQGAHTQGRNGVSHGIVIVGDYSRNAPADRDLDALVELLRHGHDRRWWRSAELTGGHRDAPGAQTACPGAALHRLIPDINRRAAAPDDEGFDMTEDRLREIVREELQRETRAVWRDRHPAGDLGRLRRGLRALMQHAGVETTDGP